MPAEWEPHEGTWISWPKNLDTFPSDILEKVERTYIEMVRALKNEKVNILIDDQKSADRIRSILENEGITKCLLHQIKTSDVWIRDYGPIFVKDNNKIKITKWTFNAWGGKYSDLMSDDLVAQQIGKITNKETIKTNMILEGGSIDVNGCGTLLTTSQCLLNQNRNSKYTQKQIENEVAKHLGIKNFIWIKEGIAGDDTDGHIDDIARFVSKDHIVAVYEENPSDENYKLLKHNYELLSKAKLEDGQNVKLSKLPMPKALKSRFGRIPASYANFYIGNGVVLLPVFNQETDHKAVEILSECFKGRKVVPIYAEYLVWGLGGIHCVTQQQPL